jgi:hypothetical protein
MAPKMIVVAGCPIRSLFKASSRENAMKILGRWIAMWLAVVAT